jgi:hypothetical protein
VEVVRQQGHLIPPTPSLALVRILRSKFVPISFSSFLTLAVIGVVLARSAELSHVLRFTVFFAVPANFRWNVGRTVIAVERVLSHFVNLSFHTYWMNPARETIQAPGNSAAA